MEKRFELMVVPNIFSIDDKGHYDFYDAIPCDDYEEAIREMKKDIRKYFVCCLGTNGTCV